MTSNLKWVFFYGSFMNPAVLAEGGFTLGDFEVARLYGYDVIAAPLVTLISDPDRHVYGIVCQATNDAIDALYGPMWPYARLTPSKYKATAVLVWTVDGRDRSWPALCYVAPPIKRVRPTAEYLRRVIEPARQYGFPAWYLARLEDLGK